MNEFLVKFKDTKRSELFYGTSFENIVIKASHYALINRFDTHINYITNTETGEEISNIKITYTKK